MSAQRALTAAQRKVVDEIRSGHLRSEQSNSRSGRVLRTLIAKGIVGYTDKCVTKEITIRHRRLRGFVTWIGLYVIDESEDT